MSVGFFHVEEGEVRLMDRSCLIPTQANSKSHLEMQRLARNESLLQVGSEMPCIKDLVSSLWPSCDTVPSFGGGNQGEDVRSLRKLP